MKISVLDQSPSREGISPDASIRESLDLARHCETLGYYRYWVSEHHSSEAVAGSAPEILMAAIAATTSTIRVGSAGGRGREAPGRGERDRQRRGDEPRES